MLLLLRQTSLAPLPAFSLSRGRFLAAVAVPAVIEAVPAFVASKFFVSPADKRLTAFQTVF